MNSVSGVVDSVIEDDLFVKIDISRNADRFSACILHSDNKFLCYKAGLPVNMIFKESDTIVSVNNDPLISCRNRFLSKVISITSGAIMTRIVARYDSVKIVSLVTTASAGKMSIGPGSEITCMVKSTSIMLATGELNHS
jgi:molybdate transport system regulatory protein